MNPLASNIVHTDSNGEDSLLCACSVMNSPNPKTYMYNDIRNVVWQFVCPEKMLARFSILICIRSEAKIKLLFLFILL